MKIRDKAKFGCILLFLAMAAASVACGSGSTGSDSPNNQSRHIGGESWYGCSDRAHFGTLLKYAGQSDDGMFADTLSKDLAIGTCVMFKDGESVYVMDRTVTMVKVRRSGQSAEYWTFSEAVK